MTVLQTPRLMLRSFTPADLDALAPLFADAQVMLYGPGPQGREWSADWLEKRRQDYALRGYSPLAVIEKISGALMGYCGLFHHPDLDGQPEVEIGYRLFPRFWGRGYAAEAALAVREHAFHALGLTRLTALIDPQNTASIRVAEKLGMHAEKEIMLAGYDHPDILYALADPAQSV